jgi:hypothetical protein
MEVTSGAYYQILEFDYDTDDLEHVDELMFYLPTLTTPHGLVEDGRYFTRNKKPFVNLYDTEPFEYFNELGQLLSEPFSIIY